MRGTSLLLCACLLAAPACSSAPSAPPGYLTVAIVNSPNSLDPRVGTDDVSTRLHYLIFSRLLTVDDRLRVASGVATHWEMPDDRTYVVHLRRGVRFHDGRELTSADVVYTFESFLDPEFISGWKGAYRLLRRVEAIDRYTVRFSLAEPFGSFPAQLVMPVVPAGSGETLATHPIGSGPYRFVSAAADDRIILEAFPDHYEGPPKNAGLVFRVIPDDIMRALELRRGTVDLIVNDLAPDLVHQLQREEEIVATASPGTDFQYIGLNLRDPLLRDRRVRHAIGYAIDRDAIVRYLRRGHAAVAVGVLPPLSWAYEPDVFRFSYDPARAKRLLDEAGYPDPDGDGPAPRFSLSLKVSSREESRLQAAVIQEHLREIGLALDVRTYEFATLYADIIQGNFQMYTLQWVGSAVVDPDILRRVFHSNQAPPAGFNRGHYSNPQVDRLLDAATTATDDAERKRLYSEAQKLIAYDAPYISLWYKTNVAVYRADLRNVHVGPTADSIFLRHVTRDPVRTAAR
ncbi:MAG TPA: ABC transporter substrate-binding protein [Vicinamibacterales bacterium]|nr:ABC transporter substrate-binding protein [Vicinamibacterales bacterium]